METILAQHGADDAATKTATTTGTLSTQEAAIESGKLVMHGTVNRCHGGAGLSKRFKAAWSSRRFSCLL